ncbi:MAG: aminotransferase class IV, partial [Chitinophagales bacterium]
LKGKALFFNQHYVRFIEGMDAMQMEIPVEWSVPFLKNLVEETAAANKLGNARVRLTFWRKAGGYYTPENQTPEFIIEAFPLTETYYNLNANGLITEVYAEITKSVNVLSPFKSANALPYVMAGLYKSKRNLDDVLLCNTERRIIEATFSNIFLVTGKTILTPAVEEGCINGVMRRVLIKMCKQIQIDLVETQITMEDIQKADEVFLTNVMQGIRWVNKINDINFRLGIAPVLLGKLNELIMDAA